MINYKEEFLNYGVELLEVTSVDKGNYKSLNGKLRYLHTDIEWERKDIQEFLYNCRKSFKLNKDILEDCRRYNDTHIFCDKEGNLYSTRGVIKQVTPQNDQGYFVYTIDGKDIPLHHLVLESWGFKRPSKLHLVRHKNDIPSDNRLENLEWGIHLENMKDKDNNNDKRLELIRDLYSKKIYSLEEISVITKVSLSDLEEITKL